MAVPVNKVGWSDWAGCCATVVPEVQSVLLEINREGGTNSVAVSTYYVGRETFCVFHLVV